MRQPRRVLIAGGDNTEIDRYTRELSVLGCRIASEQYGNALVGRVRAFSPHLVLLDDEIEHGDASELFRLIKNDGLAMVVMITALSEVGAIERAIEAGTDDFLSKPVDSVALLGRVGNLLKLCDHSH